MTMRRKCDDAIIATVLEVFKRDTDALDAELATMSMTAKGNAARRRAYMADALGGDALSRKRTPLAMGIQYLTTLDGAFRFPAEFLTPDTVLPPSFIRPAMEALQGWVERHGAASVIEQKRAYMKDVVPVLRRMEDVVPEMLPEHMRSFAYDYINDYLNGGEFFDFRAGELTSIQKFGKNYVKNLVAFNPIIAGLNTIEWVPKTLAEYGPLNTLRAIGEVVRNSGGNLWGEIPELAGYGVYGIGDSAKPIIDPLRWTENFNRGLYYYAGALSGGGKQAGLKAVERMGYRYQPGNAPRITRARHMNDIALMRYAIGQGMMLGRWALNMSGNIVKFRNGQLSVGAPEYGKMATGAAAMATWLIAQSAVTGFRSTGVLLYDLLPEDYRQSLDELEEELPYVNVVKKATAAAERAITGDEGMTGLDLSQKMKPGGIAFGVGLSGMTTALSQTSKGVDLVREGIDTEDPTTIARGVGKFMVNSLMLAPPVKIPALGGGEAPLAEIGMGNFRKLASTADKVLAVDLSMDDPMSIYNDIKERFVGKQPAP